MVLREIFKLKYSNFNLPNFRVFNSTCFNDVFWAIVSIDVDNIIYCKQSKNKFLYYKAYVSYGLEFCQGTYHTNGGEDLLYGCTNDHILGRSCYKAIVHWCFVSGTYWKIFRV